MELGAWNGFPGPEPLKCCYPHWKSQGIWCGLESYNHVTEKSKLWSLPYIKLCFY